METHCFINDGRSGYTPVGGLVDSKTTRFLVLATVGPVARNLMVPLGAQADTPSTLPPQWALSRPQQAVHHWGSFLRYQHKTHISVSIYGCQWAVQRWHCDFTSPLYQAGSGGLALPNIIPTSFRCRSGPERGNRQGPEILDISKYCQCNSTGNAHVNA